MLRLDDGRRVIVAVLFASALSGCGGGGGTAPPAQVPETPPPVTPPPVTPPPVAQPPAVPPPAVPPVGCENFASTSPEPLVVVPPGSPAGLSVATSARFSGSGTCATCHRTDLATTPATNVDLVSGEVVGITNDWAGTMMANAARDPYFLAALTAEMNAVPTLATGIQTKCLTCHAPMASYEARLSGTNFGLVEMYASELGRDGVACTLCHRIEAANLGSEASFSGQFTIGDETGTARRVYGPLVAVATNPMVTRVAMTPTFGAHVRESRMCGACHTLRTEAVDPVTQGLTGIVFPEQMPYKEWLASSFVSRSSCQGCHVPTSDGSVRLSSFGPTRGQVPFGKHHFVGGNAFMLGLMREDRAGANELQLSADLANFDASIARTVNGLSQSTAKLAATACTTVDSMTVDVTVANLTGHKLPTGYPNRRLWLHVKLVDASGAVVFDSGGVGADGEIAGLDPAYEPHYQTIRQSDQVQVYEAVMGDIADRPTLRLLHAAKYLKDNRLLPEGMNRDVTDAEIRPVGVSTDADFGNGQDRLSYVISTAGYRAPFALEVELLYQAAPPRHVAGLGAHTSAEIARFLKLYQGVSNVPRAIARVNAAVH